VFRNLTNSQRNTRQIRIAPERIVSNAQNLPECAEQNFLVGVEPRQTHAVDAYAAIFCAAGTFKSAAFDGRVRQVAAVCLADIARRLDGGARRRVDFAVVMQFDHFGGVHETRRDAREMHHQHAAHGEIRGPYATLAVFQQSGVQRLECVRRQATGAADHVQARGDGCLQDRWGDLAGGEVDQDIGFRC
jgi:hypothetical protein